MSELILTEIHGRELGLDATRNLISPVGVKTPALKLGASGLEVDVAGQIDISAAALAAAIGTVATVTGLTCTVKRVGSWFKLDFTFASVAVTHTDAAGSGSSGSLKIFDFVEGAVMPLASRSNLTFLGDALIDTNAGDMAFVYGFGSVAANAGDGALTGTEVDFSAVSGAITLSAKAGSSPTLLKGAGTAVDGTATAADLYFNESGSAATSDANGVLTVSGTYTLVGVLLGDD
jgi:hypothetical protein